MPLLVARMMNQQLKNLIQSSYSYIHGQIYSLGQTTFSLPQCLLIRAYKFGHARLGQRDHVGL